MDKNKDNGVSPVIATVLLIALSIVLISLVSLSIMSAVGSFTPVETKVVGFTVSVNATANTALVTPVSGNDLPFMESYRVYTNNGHWDKQDAGDLTIPDFNSTVTYVNIVGNFSDNVTTLVFSGKVVIEGGVVVVEPTHGGYYVVGSDGYDTTVDFANSFNEWYNTYYNTTLHPGDPGYEVVTVFNNDKDFSFSNDYPILVGDRPIELSIDNIHDLSPGNVQILIAAAGNFERAPGYSGALLQIGNASDSGTTQVTVKSSSNPLTLNGNNIDGVTSALLVITSEGILSVPNGETLIVKNNLNLYGDGFGGGIYVDDGGQLVVKGMVRANSNSANYGGGIYKARGGSVTTHGSGEIIYSGNTATAEGNDIYNAP